MSKLNVALMDMDKYGFYNVEDIPPFVYHLTTKECADIIIQDGKIKTFDDYVCWVCKDIDSLLEYIEIYGRDKQGYTHDTKGQLIQHGAWNLDDMVILKLEHISKPFKWFKEITYHEGQPLVDLDGKPFDYDVQQRMKKQLNAAEHCRLAYYGNMRFNKENVEVLPLKPYYENYEPKWKNML